MDGQQLHEASGFALPQGMADRVELPRPQTVFAEMGVPRPPVETNESTAQVVAAGWESPLSRSMLAAVYRENVGGSTQGKGQGKHVHTGYQM